MLVDIHQCHFINNDWFKCEFENKININDSALLVIYQDGFIQAICDLDGMLEHRPMHRNKQDRWKSQRMTVDLIQTK